MRLHHLFLRFGGASLATGATDQVIFFVAFRLGAAIGASMIIARLLASILNLYLNRCHVFRSNAGLGGTLLRYYACMALNGTAAYIFIRVAQDRLLWPVVPSKIGIELALFVVSFVLSRTIIFRHAAQEVPSA